MRHMDLGPLFRRLLAGMSAAGAPFDVRACVEGHNIRFTNALDDEAERFEHELLEQPIVPCNDTVGHDGSLTSETGCVALHVRQLIAWLRHSDAEVRLLQVRSSDRHPSMQAAIVVDRPRWSPWLGEAVAPRLGHAVSGLEELYGLRPLRTLCGASCGLVTLRLQAGRLGVHALCDFEQRARRAGFVLAEPEGVTRTLLLDLRASSGELLASLSGKTRRKVRARESSPFEIRPITDTVHIEALKAAALASIHRTGGTNSRAPWGPLLALARDEPTHARVLALFRRGGQDVPLAFAAAVRHRALAEYMSAGSIDDAELRAQPFNYFLLWELADWARASGATHLDLGGLTEGGPEDALAGISTFKRHFTCAEAEVGREMIAVLRPGAQLLLDGMRRIRAHAEARP